MTRPSLPCWSPKRAAGLRQELSSIGSSCCSSLGTWPTTAWALSHWSKPPPVRQRRWLRQAPPRPKGRSKIFSFCSCRFSKSMVRCRLDEPPSRRDGKRARHGGDWRQGPRKRRLDAYRGMMPRGRILRRKNLLWIARNPLKSPESDEGIQENPSPFSWSFLVFLGLALVRLGATWPEAPLIASGGSATSAALDQRRPPMPTARPTSASAVA